jgi:hypothetical protein
MYVLQQQRACARACMHACNAFDRCAVRATWVGPLKRHLPSPSHTLLLPAAAVLLVCCSPLTSCPHRELFDTEQEAARAYDTAVWRLKPREARNYANFKDSCPPDVAEALKAADKVRLQLCFALCSVLSLACVVAAAAA